MTNRYSYKESLFRAATKDNSGLSLTSNDKYILKISRLLSGTCDATDLHTENTYRFRTNFFIWPKQENNKVNQASFIGIFPDEIKKNELSTYFKRTAANEQLYKTLESEIINCLISIKNGRSLEAFLFLYRVIEGISFCLPLIYISQSRSYKKSFSELKKYLHRDAKSELNFFKNFISGSGIGEDYSDTSVKIDLSDVNPEELKPKYYEIYIRSTNRESIIDKDEDEFVEISFVGFYEFLLNLRNKYFHFLQEPSRNNISTLDIVNPDAFFSPIIGPAVNYISIIIYEIIRSDMEGS